MWGMTELSPVGSIGLPTGQQLAEGMSTDDLMALKVSRATALHPAVIGAWSNRKCFVV